MLKILMLRPGNLYAANGVGLVLAEKGHFDVSKDIFTQVQEAASGSVIVQMPDVNNGSPLAFQALSGMKELRVKMMRVEMVGGGGRRVEKKKEREEE
ncbi:uncharacterized protein A4U43_C06F9790 [Asparagus officinalis]|uniref:Uncharacterized protein n=1 Tax=Asparagus officinalis TaxID=4686 RepID=A0A5P1EKQ6_ASPOF|nr:uncharacterized protein A4U43_C06F9790 [Asparagus officinalis]